MQPRFSLVTASVRELARSLFARYQNLIELSGFVLLGYLFFFLAFGGWWGTVMVWLLLIGFCVANLLKIFKEFSDWKRHCVHLFLSFLCSLCITWTHLATLQRVALVHGKPTVTAILNFKRVNKRWPNNLAELTPQYLRSNPALSGTYYSIYGNNWDIAFPQEVSSPRYAIRTAAESTLKVGHMMMTVAAHQNHSRGHSA